MPPIGFGLVGFKGFARQHLGSIDRLGERGRGRLAGIVIIDPEENADAVEEFRGRGTPIYHSLDDMLARADDVDVVCLPVPIPLHAPFAVKALESGRHVICEKPPAATIQDLLTMAEAERRSGKHCVIHFQQIHCPLIQHVKNLIRQGALGALESVSTYTVWKRLDTYYERTYWAGKIAAGGQYVLDGSINNPLAHQLHNALYLAGAGPAWANPTAVQAELYRGHEVIESEDTAVSRVWTHEGVMVHFVGTLIGPRQEQTRFTVTGSEASLDFDLEGNILLKRPGKEPEPTFVDADHGHMMVRVFENLADALEGKQDRPRCTVKDTEPFVRAMNGTWLSAYPVEKIPDEFLDIHPETDPKDGRQTRATEWPEAFEMVEQAGRKCKLFSELELPWAKARDRVDVVGLEAFALPGVEAT